MKAMETVQDLIDEAKVRTLYWVLFIFAVSYFLSHTSKSMWMNVPVALLLVSVLRILSNKVEFHWREQSVRQKTYLSHLEKKQLSVNDSRLSTAPPPPKWKRKIDSPAVEAAANEFINKILQDFVVDLWYSDITPDKEAPELIHAIIMDVLGEISGRVKELNLVDLLTRDIVNLVGDHLDLYRRNQLAIGPDVMGMLSTEERDERLKHHLMTSRELHPALISPECEYKVLQQLVGGMLAVVLRPREAQCPLVRCIARELVTCLVLQPVMNFASPLYINELIEYLFLATEDDRAKEAGDRLSENAVGHKHQHGHAGAAQGIQNDESSLRRYMVSGALGTGKSLVKVDNQIERTLDASGNSFPNAFHEKPMLPKPADWARVLDAATQRRTEVLMPENLENLWSKGRNYKSRVDKKTVKGDVRAFVAKSAEVNSSVPNRNFGEEMLTDRPGSSIGTEKKTIAWLSQSSEDLSEEISKDGSKNKLKRSNSTSILNAQPNTMNAYVGEGGGSIISEFYSPNFGMHNQEYSDKSASDMVVQSEGLNVPKLKCRVIGAYFEKIGSKSFAVYSIAVTDAENKTWFVKRRYRNFERLHRHLKDIPNYTLHLPPKRIFSSSTEDAFVHQRCIHLDKYLQDLLSIANVAEQHEVWDFLSASSKNYSFGKSASVMRTLAVNVDDAVDDIVRQFKGVSDGLMRKVAGSSNYVVSSTISDRNLLWYADDPNRLVSRHSTMDSANSFSDNEEGDKDEVHGPEEVMSSAHDSGWHSDNELNSKGFPPRVIQRNKVRSLDYEKKHGTEVKSELAGSGGFSSAIPVISDNLEDPVGVPPEWMPPNVSVPLLNLVDKIFQLKRRGWLRRQVFWISKQILQLVMEDAIDDFLLRQINFLRRDDIIAEGIRWVQDALWPDGTFYTALEDTQTKLDSSELPHKSLQDRSHSASGEASKLGSFELQLEAARRANDVKKMIFGGAPTALVSLIGHKQYKRCAKDIYYFLQSTICVKQLAYGILELLLMSVFPELRDLILDTHKKMRAEPV